MILSAPEDIAAFKRKGLEIIARLGDDAVVFVDTNGCVIEDEDGVRLSLRMYPFQVSVEFPE